MTGNEPAGTDAGTTDHAETDRVGGGRAGTDASATRDAPEESHDTGTTSGGGTGGDGVGTGVKGVGLATLVRDGETVAGTCPYCGRPFAAASARDLHVGEAHADACSAAEREAYADALAAEEDELFYFHLRVVAGLAALYTVIVLAYMIALGSGFL